MGERAFIAEFEEWGEEKDRKKQGIGRREKGKRRLDRRLQSGKDKIEAKKR